MRPVASSWDITISTRVNYLTIERAMEKISNYHILITQSKSAFLKTASSNIVPFSIPSDVRGTLNFSSPYSLFQRPPSHPAQYWKNTYICWVITMYRVHLFISKLFEVGVLISFYKFRKRGLRESIFLTWVHPWVAALRIHCRIMHFQSLCFPKHWKSCRFHS